MELAKATAIKMTLNSCELSRFFVVILATLHICGVECWLHPLQLNDRRPSLPPTKRPHRSLPLATPSSSSWSSTRRSSSSQDLIEYQSDASKYGRGEMHLSAAIDMGDVVVYQTGSWLVDGVVVGEDTPPEFRYALVETVQLVWTHNCEHGVIRGLPLVRQGATVLALDPTAMDECVEFGPEQLVAKLPVNWDEIQLQGVSAVPLDDSMWVEQDEE